MSQNTRLMTVAADGHLHLYPGHDWRLVLQSLTSNLRRAVSQAAGRPPDLFLGFLAESSRCDAWEKLRQQAPGAVPEGVKVRPGPGPVCLTIDVAGAGTVWLVAGRQIVTRERLEVLGLALRASIPDGIMAAAAVRRIIDAGGVPVLAWSPGKWLGSRGRHAQRLMDGALGPALRLGDSSLRPAGWPEPRLMRRGRLQGRPVINGSDPLPLAGAEVTAGTYGFMYHGPFDMAHPTMAISALLSGMDDTRKPVGRRAGLLTVARRLAGLRFNRLP